MKKSVMALALLASCAQATAVSVASPAHPANPVVMARPALIARSAVAPKPVARPVIIPVLPHTVPKPPCDKQKKECK